MPYSVIGGPAIGFDLARLPGGPLVAEVLRTALNAGAPEIERLAEQHPGAQVREEWRRARAAVEDLEPTLDEVLPLAGAAIEEIGRGETTTLHRLETSLLGDSHALDRLVRRDLLGWTWIHSGAMSVQDPAASLAADVLADAALASYLSELLETPVRRAMATPFVRTGLVSREDMDTGMGAVDHRLALVAGADEDDRAAWRRAVDEQRGHTAQWAPAMHQATWALSLSDRFEAACDAQLAAVLAFRRGGFTVQDAAYGVWNAISGGIQSAVVGDLLPAEDGAVLDATWQEVYGEDA